MFAYFHLVYIHTSTWSFQNFPPPTTTFTKTTPVDDSPSGAGGWVGQGKFPSIPNDPKGIQTPPGSSRIDGFDGLNPIPRS